MSAAQVDGEEREYSEDGCVKEPTGPPIAVAVPESSMKISHTSPDIPLEAQAKMEKNQVHTLARDRVQRQITEPTSSVRSVYITPWNRTDVFVYLHTSLRISVKSDATSVSLPHDTVHWACAE